MKLIILDRDGVINEDSPEYIKSPDEWHPLPGALEAIAALNAKGYQIVVATNQSGLARGLFDDTTLKAIHAKMQQAAIDAGGEIHHVFYCPHGPNEGCECRKPKPGLLFQIAKHFDISLENVWFVGDSIRDIEAALAAGATPALVLTGNGTKTKDKHPNITSKTATFNSLLDFSGNITPSL